MKTTLLSCALLASLALGSCQNNSTETAAETDQDTARAATAENDPNFPVDQTPRDQQATTQPEQIRMEKGGLKVYSMRSPDFVNAKLELNAPNDKQDVPSGKVTFDYTVTAFDLGKPTPGADTMGIAASDHGQHIHNIVDNEPYTAHYEKNFQKELKDGTHIVLSFLSRSYHESLKHPAAYDLTQFTVGKKAADAKFADLSGPLLFYSRPKGDYVGPKETGKVLLDFYLVNTTLAKDGNQVRATINGNEFMLPDWRPYIIEGLPMGESTIKLELLGKDGKVIPGPYNTVERKITLKQS